MTQHSKAQEAEHKSWRWMLFNWFMGAFVGWIFTIVVSYLAPIGESVKSGISHINWGSIIGIFFRETRSLLYIVLVLTASITTIAILYKRRSLVYSSNTVGGVTTFSLLTLLYTVIASIVIISSFVVFSNPQTRPPQPATPSKTSTPIPIRETFKVFFAKGRGSVTTTQSYKAAEATITISNTAKIAQTEFADALYFYPPFVSRSHNIDATLWINNQPVDKFLKGPLPVYRSDHTYTFHINVPNGVLTFGVGDRLAQDTTGFFTVQIIQG